MKNSKPKSRFLKLIQRTRKAMRAKLTYVLGVDEDGHFYQVRKLASILLICLACSCGYGQTTVKLNAAGNYEQIKTERKQTEAKQTGKTFTDSKGRVYPVYESAKGKLFVVKTSAKTGNAYNYYLTETK
jgi:hypothetical protein